MGRVPVRVESGRDEMPASVVLSEQALRLHRSCLVIDGHNDLAWRLYKQADSGDRPVDLARPQPGLHTDIPRLIAGGVGAQFWAAYVPPTPPHGVSPAACALGQIDLIHGLALRYPETFAIAHGAEEIEHIRAQGKIASLIGVEGGRSIENSLGVLRSFSALGALYLTLTHGETTDWCDSATDRPRHGGLTLFGQEVVREMNRLGMLADISHVSVEAAEAVLRVSRAPVIASHSSAAAVAAHPRNLPDALLKRIADNGGLVMVNFFSGYIEPGAARIMDQQSDVSRTLRAAHPNEEEYQRAYQHWKDEHPIPRGTVHKVVDHIDHIVRVAGVDHVGVGADFDGVSTLPEQLDDVSSYPYLTQGLLDRGYDEPRIRKILGQNLLRVLRRAEQEAGRGNGSAGIQA